MAFLLCVGFGDYGVLRKVGSGVGCPLSGRYEPMGKTMVVDKEYMKGLLEAVQSSDKPTTDIKELEHQGFSYKDD
ncbi:TPA: hypothetical protein ACSQL7_003543, partial [Vibrio cholerae]